MKKSTCSFCSFLLCFVLIFSYENTQAQLWNKIKNEVKNRTENKVVNKVGNATDKAIDNTADAVKGDKSGNESVADNEQSSSAADANVTSDTKSKSPSVSNYKSYDFVPGDKIIFQPDLSSEADAELPARFTVNVGNAEIQSYEGEKILHLNPDCNATISPSMNPDNYLPEQYTLEFDMMYENKDGNYFRYASDFYVEFRKPEDNNYRSYPFYKFGINGVSKIKFGDVNTGSIALPEELTGNTWHHIAIYIRKNIGKVYIDQYRVAATNTLPVGAGKVDIRGDRYGIKIKNFRLAAGGDDKYNKIVTDGKFISHGILFDVNKSTIKPESMGALNEIVKLMKEHNDLKFEIDGHTDSDGKADANLKLSQDRADAVKAKLVEMGIEGSRLSTKGFGAAKPIDKNDNAEGKANNRRVKFVKI